MKTVLVTGGAGYKGCILVPKLLDAGYAVVVYDCAVNALGELSPLTGESMVKLLSRMRAEPPAEKEPAARHSRKVTQLIRAVGGMRGFHDPEAAEAALLEAASRAAGHKKGFVERIRKSAAEEDAAVVGAAMTALRAIGSTRSEEFLSKLAEGKPLTPRRRPKPWGPCGRGRRRARCRAPETKGRYFCFLA